MLRLAARIQRSHPVLVDQVLGTRDPAQIEAALRAMPLEIDRCFHFELSVGAVFGLELADGRRVAVKVHQPSLATEELEAQQAVQAHLAARGFPCPRPVLGPTPFLERLATAEGDSISIDYESVALGGAAATHTAAIHARVFRPRSKPPSVSWPTTKPSAAAWTTSSGEQAWPVPSTASPTQPAVSMRWSCRARADGSSPRHGQLCPTLRLSSSPRLEPRCPKHSPEKSSS